MQKDLNEKFIRCAVISRAHMVEINTYRRIVDVYCV